MWLEHFYAWSYNCMINYWCFKEKLINYLLPIRHYTNEIFAQKQIYPSHNCSPAYHLRCKVGLVVFDLLFVTSIARKDSTAAGKPEPSKAFLVVLTRAGLRQRMTLSDSHAYRFLLFLPERGIKWLIGAADDPLEYPCLSPSPLAWKSESQELVQRTPL